MKTKKRTPRENVCPRCGATMDAEGQTYYCPKCQDYADNLEDDDDF